MNRFQSLFASVPFIFSTAAVSCNEDEKTAENKLTTTSSISNIEGAWETVTNDGKVLEFKLFHDGFFSLMRKDLEVLF